VRDCVCYIRRWRYRDSSMLRFDSVPPCDGQTDGRMDNTTVANTGSELCSTSHFQSLASGSRHASSTATTLAANPSSRTVKLCTCYSQSSVSGVLVWCRAVCRDHINTRRTPIGWNHKLYNSETTVQVRRACVLACWPRCLEPASSNNPQCSNTSTF